MVNMFLRKEPHMRLHHLFPAVALFAALAASPACAEDAAQKVATVNPAGVFEKMEERNDAQKALNNALEDFKKKDADFKAKLNDLKSRRDQLDNKSKQFSDLNQQLMNDAIQYDTWTKISQANMQREQKQMLVTLFRQIQEAVGKVAVKRQLDIVLTDQKVELPDDPNVLGQMDINQLRALINSQVVIYNGGKVDITQDVILLLNNEYLNKHK